MMFKRVLATLLSCLVPAALHATVLLPADFREIVNGADLIVYARVADTEVRWSDDRTQIETLVTLQAGTYLKGSAGESLVIKVPGGTIGRYMNVLVGAPAFTAGDEAVFFLHARGREYPAVFGLHQGVFRVSVDARTRRRLVSPPLISRGSTPATVVRGDTARRPLPLETFGDQVKSVLADTARTAR